MKKFDFKRLLLPVVALAMMLPVLTACSSSDDPGNSSFPTSLRMVTLRQYLPSGGMVFTYRTGAVTPLITLTSSVSFDTAAVRPGQRVIIGFNTLDARPDTVSGPIDLKVYRTVYNDTVISATPQVKESWSAAMVGSTQVWRTGNFINIGANIPYNSPLVPMALYADEDNINAGICNMYATLKNINAAPGQLVEAYSSINIVSFLRKHPEVHTFVIHMAGNVDYPVTIDNISILPED